MSEVAQVSLVDIARRMEECPPSADAITQAAMDHFELCRSLSDAYPMQFAALSEHLRALRAHLEGELLAAGHLVEDQSRPIPRVPPETLAESDFADFARRPCPVIFEGAARNVEAVARWSPRYFGDNYGDYPCLLATEDKWDISGTLSDAIADILAPKQENLYAQNIANIFNEHPDLEAQLELDRFLPHLGRGRHLGTHLFIGGSKTGTNFHCANNLNIFFNVHGRKEWFFVHPKHTFWMYGLLHKTGGYGDSPVDHRRPAAEQRDDFPLYEQVPVYSAQLEPGDVLINPPWWWHAVNNLTNATIGCAVRWMPYEIDDSNPIFSLAQGLVPHAKEVMRALRDPQARITDELYREGFEPIRKEK